MLRCACCAAPCCAAGAYTEFIPESLQLAIAKSLDEQDAQRGWLSGAGGAAAARGRLRLPAPDDSDSDDEHRKVRSRRLCSAPLLPPAWPSAKSGAGWWVLGAGVSDGEGCWISGPA